MVYINLCAIVYNLLVGTGVIVGVADTGVDIEHCMFIDRAHGRVPPSSAEQVAIYASVQG